MNTRHVLALSALLLTGAFFPTLHGQALLDTDFNNGELQGWTQYSTTETQLASFGTSEVAPREHVLRFDNTVTGTGQSWAEAQFAPQSEGVLKFSLSIRILSEGGLGSSNEGNVRVGILGGSTGTYVRLRVRPTQAYKVEYFSRGNVVHQGDLEIKYDVWYDLVQTLHLPEDGPSTYSFTIQNRSNPTEFYQSDEVTTFNPVETVYRIGIWQNNASLRSGLYEIGHAKVEVIPEPGSATLTLLTLGAAGGMVAYRRGRKVPAPADHLPQAD